jgi:hypothetical protein
LSNADISRWGDSYKILAGIPERPFEKPGFVYENTLIMDLIKLAECDDVVIDRHQWCTAVNMIMTL